MKTFQSDDPAKCAEAIVDRVGRHIRLGAPIAIGKPNRLLNALYRIAEADRGVTLEIFTGISLARAAFQLTGASSVLAALDLELLVQAARAAAAGQSRYEFFLQAGAWLSHPTRHQSYTSLNYSHVAGHLMRAETGALRIVAPILRRCGARSDSTPRPLDMVPYVELGARPASLWCCRRVFAAIHAGEAEVGGELDVLLEGGQSYDLFAPPKEPVSLSDYAMALHAATLIRDGGTLQIGIGSFADALAHALILRHTRNAEFRALVARLGTPLHADAELTPFSAGLYGCTEMLVDGWRCGAGILATVAMSDGRHVSCRRLAVGNHAFYRELRDMRRRARSADGDLTCQHSR